MSKKYTLLTFKGICMNFLLKLKFFILGHPVTSKKPHKIVQILLGHPVVGFCHLVGTGIAPVSKKTAVKVMSGLKVGLQILKEMSNWLPLCKH